MSEPVTLLAVAGQSNALGYLQNTSTLPAEFQQPNGTTYIWNELGGFWEIMAPGINTGAPGMTDTWGIEVGIAHQWHAANPDQTLYLVKFARGSTSLAVDAGAKDWNPANSNELFQRMADAMRVAKADLQAQGLTVGVPGIFWAQGEADAYVSDYAASYAENLSAFLAAVREAWGDQASTFVFNQVHSETGFPFAAEVRAAQLAVQSADPNSAAIIADDLALQGDNLHSPPMVSPRWASEWRPAIRTYPCPIAAPTAMTS